MDFETEIPLGLVFPEPVEADRFDFEPASLPIGRAGENRATREQQAQGGKKLSHGPQGTSPAGLRREWYCNAEFDLTLGHAAQTALPAKLLATAREMAWHFWPVLPPEDRLLVPAAPPPGFVEYLRDLRLAPPAFAMEPSGEGIFTPFGWNPEAASRAAGYRKPPEHPGVDVMARVNSREFGLRLESELFADEKGTLPGGIFFRDPVALGRWLALAHPGKWVAKGNHGHAGIGQLRFAFPGARDNIAHELGLLLDRHQGLVVEPEHEIEIEFGVLFRISQRGAVSPFRFHRLASRSGGGFAGARLPVESRESGPWIGAMEKAVAGIAGRLRDEGYFGPVGIDMYAWKDGDGLRFRSLVDLNARCSMAYPVHGLGFRFPGRVAEISHLYGRFLNLPSAPDALRTRLGGWHFDPETRRGAFLITPLMTGMRRHSLACLGRDGEDLRRIQTEAMRVLSHE